MNIMSFFSQKPATPAPAAPANPAPVQGQQPPQAAPAPQAPAPEPQGLDKFKDIWTNPAVTAPQNQQPSILDVDQGKVVEGVSKLNFTQVVSPDLMQKALSGGEGAQQAMMEAMNRVAQATAAQQQVQQAGFLKEALAEMKTSLTQELRNSVRRDAAFEGVRADNPLFSHPATQPIMAATVEALTRQHPNATAGEIQQLARDYVKSFASAVSPQSAAPATSTSKSGDLNWAAWADNGKF